MAALCTLEGPVTTTTTGIKPTGLPHLGNYLGMLRPALDLATPGPASLSPPGPAGPDRALCFIADYHALSTVPDPEAVRAAVLDLAATLIAFGLDPDRVILYRQSDLPQVCELTWILTCVCPKGLLNRAHAYKAAAAANTAAGRDPDQGVGMGLFSYPLLMAADILLHQAALVPVGSDQRQHVEIARDLAQSFNRRYGPVFTVPGAVVDSSVPSVPGIDGRKMSKSYGNQIPLSASADQIRRLVSRIVTDSARPGEPKAPDTVLALYRLVAPPDAAAELARGYARGGVSYAAAKDLLTGAIEALIGPARARHAELMASPAEIRQLLAHGAVAARESAAVTLTAARAATGLGWS
jgi:tryptophanyl-tRNA synthetase